MNNSNFSQYANSFQAIAKLRLESIRQLLFHLGNPQENLKFIHIAGTNGKGSVCAFLQCILSEAGFKTGKYISPNLVDVTERISIDGKLIDAHRLEKLLKEVEKSARLVEKEQGELPTQFEIWTAAAFCYFKECGCDLVVLETGLGGTRDATNIIPPPLVSVITRIDLDHTEYLGNTLREIAMEKAGIIKAPKEDSAFGTTIISPQGKDVMSVFNEVCEKRHNQLIVADTPQITSSHDFHEIFNYKEITNIKCGITGFYQPENASLAIETALFLGISEETIKNGIKKARNPARFEIIQNNPLVIYDGAHNKNGLDVLIKSIRHYIPDWQGATFIMAFMKDKDIHSSLSILKDSGLLDDSQLFTVKVKDNPRASKAEDICSIAESLEISATPFPHLEDAYKTALAINKPIIICGSLYLYKDFKEIQ